MRKDKQEAVEITPELDRCTLHSGKQGVHPAGRHPTSLREYTAGELRVVMGAEDVRAFRRGRRTPQWTAKIPADTALVWLGADEKAIYLSGFQAGEKPGDWRPDSPARIRRLNLTSGKWLSDLPLRVNPEANQTESVEGVLTGNGCVMVLTLVDEGQLGTRTSQLSGYRVSCFDVGKIKPRWSESFPSAGEPPRPGVYLLSASGAPEKVQPVVRPLYWLGKDVLACAGPMQDILCLNPKTGEVRWRVPRVWEFERGFIGPSVWTHFFQRVATAGTDGEKKPELPARHQAIVGGPIVVDGPKGREEKQSVFVAVAKGPVQYAEYLSDCLGYELDAKGEPIGMVTLPRMVLGDAYRVVDGGVVWACQGGAFVRLASSGNRGGGYSMGPGGPDLVCRVEWYRELQHEKSEVWLSSDPVGDLIAFGDSVAFRVNAGGYVPDQAAGVYHFPIASINLETGISRKLELRVPYQEKLPEPMNNYSRSGYPDGKVSWRTRGPYLLAITALQIEGNRLRITLGMEKWAETLEFEFGELLESESE